MTLPQVHVAVGRSCVCLPYKEGNMPGSREPTGIFKTNPSVGCEHGKRHHIVHDLEFCILHVPEFYMNCMNSMDHVVL